MPTTLPDYEDVAERLDSSWDKPDGKEFRGALEQLVVLAEHGNLEAAEFLAEILALDGRHHDAAAAYKWYFIVLSQQGYSVAFRDLNGIPPAYGGPVGDFRNEAMVSDLVSELGFERVKVLDQEGVSWLHAHGLPVPEVP
jgi:hypothetical protein